MGEQIAILGAGVMGETLLSGLLRAGWTADDVVITERRADRATELGERYGVRVSENVEAAAALGIHSILIPHDDDGARAAANEILSLTAPAEHA